MNGDTRMAAKTNTLSDELHEGESDARLIDLHRIFGIARRRRWWIVATVVIILVLTAVAYTMVPRRYMGTASIALDRRADQIIAGQSPNQELPTDSPTVDTAVEVLTSPSLAARVVDTLNLQREPGFGQAIDGPVLSPAAARSRAISKVQSGLAVKRTGLSYAIDTSFTWTDPKHAAAVVNALVDEYIASQRDTKVDSRTNDNKLLRERLSRLRDEVIRAETAEAQYRANTNLIDVQKDSTAVQQELSFLNTQLATAQADQAAAEARLRAARGGGGNAAADFGSPVIRSLRQQQAQLSAQRADLAGRYGPLHPDLAKLDRQYADVNNSIRDETRRTLAGLVADARVSAGRTSAIRSSLDRAQGGLQAGNRASVQLNELQRNADSARGLYQAFLDRYRQSVAGEGTDKSNASVISRAMVPGGPVFPNAAVFGAGGILASLLAAVGVVLLLELLESGFQNRRQVEARLHVPVIGTVPDLATIPGARISKRDPMAPANFLVENQGSLFSESFRSIRSALKIGRPDQVVRSLAVSSALPGEGKTTISICLARSAALAGAKVVVIDCDVRRRTFSRSVTNDTAVGLIEVLDGTAQLDKALLHDTASGAYILPQSNTKSMNYELVASQAMFSLIQSLSERFDLVLLDTPPVLPLAEARAIAAMADGVLFVTRWRKTPANASELAVDMLAREGAKIYGVALSQVNLKQQSRAGFGDEMSYYHRFKGYYAEAG
ncbi:hypothetical protein ASE72_06495 [Sphingomonas sp. Leaf20]|nr:hypothetical protein ASE72_06495 [Sphingomonas sp. Leaf20]